MSLPPKYPLITLMQLEAKHVAELNKILTMSVSRLDKDIKALGKAGANPITIMQAKATKASLQSFIGQTFASMEDVIRVGMKDAAAAASGVVSAYEAQMLGMVMSPEAVANLARSEAQRAAQGIEAALKRVQGSSYVPLSNAVYKTQQMTLGWVEKRITQGLASGWSAQKLAGELKSMINPNVKGGVSYAAMRTARTEINNSFHASSAERYLNSPVVLEVNWSLSSSHPEGDICDTLADDSPYPKKSVPQKPHPQCYCYITPDLPEPAKFVDNLFKGKYGSPPTAAQTTAQVAPKLAKAGSKAASTAAQNAMHAAIKTDPKPTKMTLGNQLNMEKALWDDIADPEAFQKIVNAMDDVDKKWFDAALLSQKKTLMGATKDGVGGDEYVDNLVKWMKSKSQPAKVAKFSDADYDELLDPLGEFYVAILKKNNIDPVLVYKIGKPMNKEQFSAFKDIILNSQNPSGGKWLNQALTLERKSNGYTGDLVSLSKGELPKKVWTKTSLADEYDLDPIVLNSLDSISKLTPDQMAAQLAKLTADDLAEIKKLDVYDQSYYIKMATTPTKDSYLKPTTKPATPTYKSLAKQFETTEELMVGSGATPQQILYILKGGPGSSGFQQGIGEAFAKLKSDNARAMYLGSAKHIDFKNIPEVDLTEWKKKYGFLDDTQVPVPKSKYADLEFNWGIPEEVFIKAGLDPDEAAAAFKALQDNKAGWKAFNDALYDGDQNQIAMLLKYNAPKKPPIIDPKTIPAPKVPSVPAPPKEVLDTYADVADIFPAGNWKPNLLQKTGSTPQQISDYVQDMNQAQFDNFMSLKWPSQKKHFEKLATNTDNASTYQTKVAFQQGDGKLPQPKPPLTSDPEVLAKWQGKTQPLRPIEPKPPLTPGAKAYEEFLDKSKQKFKDFAASTGNAKNDLTKSLNWPQFQKVVDSNDLTALKSLQTAKYIDQDLYDLAIEAGKRATKPDAGDAAKFKTALDDYAKVKAQFDADLVEWRAANGVTSQAKGVWDGALVHADNSAGVSWATQNLKLATGERREALKRYSGSSYSPWNGALRQNANGDSLPSGSWGSYTAKADAGMSPAPEDFIVRRGTGWDEFVIGGGRKGYIPPPPPSDLVGSVQTQHGYTSTSVGSSSAFGGNVSMRIRIPQGHPVSWVDPFSSHKGERELLISRSSNYYIHDVYQENGRWFVDAEIVPVGEDASMWSPIKSANRS